MKYQEELVCSFPKHQEAAQFCFSNCFVSTPPPPIPSTFSMFRFYPLPAFSMFRFYPFHLFSWCPFILFLRFVCFCCSLSLWIDLFFCFVFFLLFFLFEKENSQQQQKRRKKRKGNPKKEEKKQKQK